MKKEFKWSGQHSRLVSLLSKNLTMGTRTHGWTLKKRNSTLKKRNSQRCRTCPKQDRQQTSFWPWAPNVCNRWAQVSLSTGCNSIFFWIYREKRQRKKLVTSKQHYCPAWEQISIPEERRSVGSSFSSNNFRGCGSQQGYKELHILYYKWLV